VNTKDLLREHGLTATIEDDFLVIRGKGGRECTYSGRIFARVLFAGPPVVEARLVRLGVGEIKLDGQVLTITDQSKKTPLPIE
jgi:hypothetical protein